MSIENGTNFTMPVTPACYGNNGNGSMWGGDWSSWIILFLIFGMFGYGDNITKQLNFSVFPKCSPL